MLRALGSPLRFERTPVEHHRGGPMLGEHTAEVLRDLGWTDEDVEKLAGAGIIGRT
jgi:formyl-CoA transferase